MSEGMKIITNPILTNGDILTQTSSTITNVTGKEEFTVITMPKTDQPVYLWNFNMVNGKLVKVH